MRRFLLLMVMMALLIGIPRFINTLREERAAPSSAQTASQAVPSNEGKASVASSVQATKEMPILPPAVTAPVSSKEPKNTPQRPVSSAIPERQLDDGELIKAIQKELFRLGYYRGPIRPAWNRATRAAARKFARVSEGRFRTPPPTMALLETLRATQSAKPAETAQANPAANAKPAEPPPFVPQKKASAAPPQRVVENGANSDSYLPPWERGAPRYPLTAKAETGARPEVPGIPKSAASQALIQNSSEGVRHVARRQHRIVRYGRLRRYYSRGGEPRPARRISVFTRLFPWL